MIRKLLHWEVIADPPLTADTLLKLIPDAGETAPWDAAYRYNSDGVGGGEPRSPELFYKTPTWRRQRRENGRKLRWDTLGY